MITIEQKQKLVSALRTHTVTSVKNNQRNKLPYIISSTDIFPEVTSTDATSVDDGNSIVKYIEKKCRIYNVNKFHYNEKWYSYRFSVENPEETFGILKVENLPFRPFNYKENKKSFICRMDRLIYDDLIEPFALFVNRKFVNCNMISVVFDCDDIYLLLHDEQYNWYNLCHSEFHLMVLPFKCDYVGNESDASWICNYNAFVKSIQDSLTVRNDKIYINVPNMDSEYEYRGMVYNTGAWLYSQIKLNYLGLLSKERVNKLKKITITRYIYDEIGNLENTYATKFNALDKDVYEPALYNKICNMPYELYESKALFRFNDDGVLDYNGKNIISLCDESLTKIHYNSSAEYIYNHENNLKDYLYRDNYVTFKSGLFYPECEIDFGIMNISKIYNPTKENHDIFILHTIESVETKWIGDNFSRNYLSTAGFEHIKVDSKHHLSAHSYIDRCYDRLDYEYSDKLLYEENFQNGFDAIMQFNPLLFNDLYHTNISSTTVTGKQANESLTFDLGYENRKGLKIPRMKYKDHETYVIVFHNGELLSSYWQTIAAPNYFYIPIEKEFNEADQIELLYFLACNNNEIRFNSSSIIDEMDKYIDVDKDVIIAYCTDGKVIYDIFSVNDSSSKDEDGLLYNKHIVFKEYISPNELKIFCDYPDNMLMYQELVKPSEDIAFNVSYRDQYNNLKIHGGVLDTDYGFKDLVAVSSRKFIYERLYVDQRSYRIKLNKRFRYCDNQKQYILFINGRRMDDESFLVTIPKYSRPFWGMYIYLTKFVDPEDRIELFYVPEELFNMNKDYSDVTFGEDGYIEADRKDLIVPYDNRHYLFFINGKKIPASNLTLVDSDTIRVMQDTKSLKHLMVNPVYNDYLPEVKEYLQSNILSKYDALVDYIMNNPNAAITVQTNNFIDHLTEHNGNAITASLGESSKYDEIDRLLNIYVKMSDIERDMLARNVDKIAIINEIVRDFWVTSGYPYNEEPFIYDYEIDEIFTIDAYGNYIIPALDGNPEINIPKNDTHLIYFYSEPEENIFEIGSVIPGIKFFWEYSQGIFVPTKIVSQYMNGERLDEDTRVYEYNDDIKENMEFKFVGNTMSDIIEKNIDISFFNGVYYGVIDEDILQHFVYNPKVDNGLNNILALIPFSGHHPTSEELENEYAGLTREELESDFFIIEGLTTSNDNIIPGLGDGIIDVDEVEIMAICDGGRIIPDIFNISGTVDGETEEQKRLREYHEIMARLNCSLQDTVRLNLHDYVIGSNNYFVYAAPSRLVKNISGENAIVFKMPDVNDPDVIAHGKDDHTTPVYTDGNWDDLNTLIKLDKCEMIYLGEFEYTNPSGYTEPYMLWRTNGFFTRKYDDYGFNIDIYPEYEDIEDLPVIVE